MDTLDTLKEITGYVILVLTLIVMWRLTPILYAYMQELRRKSDLMDKGIAAHQAAVELNQKHRLIEEIVNQPRLRKRVQRRNRYVEDAQSGYVYLIGVNDEYYKIGLATDVQSRFSGLQTSTPYELHLIHIIVTEDMNRLEWLLHYRYESKRVRGEWFKLIPDDISDICAIHSPMTIEDIVDMEALMATMQTLNGEG